MKYKIVIVIAAISFVAFACNKSNPRTNSNNPNPSPVAQNPNPPSDTPVPVATPNPTQTPVPNPTPAPHPTPGPAPTPIATPPPLARNFSVTADDYTATPNMIMVNKGETVKLTLNVSTQNVYYGGLDFRSSVVNSGTILPGTSKTVIFTADSPFTIHAYWPSSGVQKHSKIEIMLNN
jgi:hypothetical protein